MITTAAEANAVQSLTSRQPEFQVSAPHGNRVFISSLMQLKKTDSSVFVTWLDRPEVPEASSVDQLLGRFVEEAEERVRRYPDSAQALTNLAIALLKRGSLDKGIEIAQRAVEIDRRNYLAIIVLARAFYRKGLFDQAERLYLEMADHWTKDPRPLAAAATLRLRQGDYEKAEELLCKAVALDDKSAETHFILGIVRINRSDLRGAIASLRLASHLDVRNPIYHHNLGVAYAFADEYARAEREFRTALAISPQSGQSVRALGRVLVTLKAPQQAIDLLLPYVEIHRQDDNARQILARAYIESGRYAHGRSLLTEVLNEHGDALEQLRRVDLINDVGITFMLEGKPQSAEIALKRAIEVGPSVSSVPYENLGRTYLFHLDQLESAIDILQRAKKLFPQAQTTRMLLAGAFAQVDRDDWAIAELEPLWRDGSAGQGIYTCLGWLYGRIGNVDSAVKVLEEGYLKYPRYAQLINNLVYTYLMCGRVNDAKSVLATLRRDEEPTPHIIATTGLLRLWEGHEKLGRELYERAERLAARAGNRDVARQVRQKMHVELARFYLRMSNLEGARREVELGLAQGVFPLSFTKELQELKAQVKASD